MNEHEKPPTPSQGSPSVHSAPAQPSQDALDSRSASRLGDALTGLTNAVNDARDEARRALKNADHREGMMRRVIELHAEEMNLTREHEQKKMSLLKTVAKERGDELHKSAEEVRHEARRLRETGEHLAPKLPHEAPDEITAEHLKLRWSTLAKYAPWIVKGAVIVGAIAASIWGALKALAHKL